MFNKFILSNCNDIIICKDVSSVFGVYNILFSVDLIIKSVLEVVVKFDVVVSFMLFVELISNMENLMGVCLIVGFDVKLKGVEIFDCDMLVVEGCVEVIMDSCVIWIVDKGLFVGKVSIDIVEVYGIFEGELMVCL